MFTQEDLKKDRKDVINKILLESGRGEVISFCSEVLDKRAYFTVDMHGNIKRKKYNYAYIHFNRIFIHLNLHKWTILFLIFSG